MKQINDHKIYYTHTHTHTHTLITIQLEAASSLQGMFAARTLLPATVGKHTSTHLMPPTSPSLAYYASYHHALLGGMISH